MTPADTRPRRRLYDAGLRLAFLIPLTPWPALRLIESQGTYLTPRHSADALASVLGLAYLSTLVVHLVGFLLILVGGREKEGTTLVWTVFAAVNGFSMWLYVGAHGHSYV